MQHVIKKQIIQLTVDKRLDAFQVQHQASENYWREVVPLLEKTFDEISNENEVIQIDTFEIDLKNLSLKDIENGNWKEKVSKQLIEQFDVVLRDASHTNIQSSPLNIIEQWFFYMQHGHLHWSTLKVDDDWRQEVLNAFAPRSASIERLRWLIHNYDQALKRIIHQHTEPFLQALVERLTAQTQNATSNMVEEIAEIVATAKKEKGSSLHEEKQTRDILWQHVFRLVALDQNNLSVEGIVKSVGVSDLLKDLPFEFFSRKPVTSAILEKLKEIFESETKEQKEKPELKPESDKKDTPAIDEEGIFVQNAGVILLHPFLNLFFRNLGLTAEEHFVNESSHEKALHLLHFLATGKTNSEEHELVIAKIMCGWNLGKPVSNSVELTTNEMTEANGLLLEAIERWDALKNTSPAGLREGFLQRSGKLYTKNSMLQLQVESSSIDVLLDYLPWNLSIVQLPWMHELLRVEWR